MKEPTIFARLIVGLGLVLAVGTVGYSILEGWTWFDSLYMTIITVTSIGFGEVHELSQTGRLFTVFIILIGFGVVAYAAVTVSRLLIEGEVEKILTRRHHMKAIEKIHHHYIVCGFGRMGSLVCREFHDRAIPFVVTELDPEAQEKIIQNGYFLSPGDATEEETLIAANIENARGLVSVLDSDASNVYAVLTARELRPRPGDHSQSRRAICEKETPPCRREPGGQSVPDRWAPDGDGHPQAHGYELLGIGHGSPGTRY